MYPVVSTTLGTYAYNGDGLRSSKTTSSGAQTFAWDVAGGLPLLLFDGSTSYVYGPGGQPLEQIDGSGNVLYFHQDQLGSTRVLTDQSGNVAATYTYDAYGNITAKTGAAGTPLGYAGEYTDAESGLQYLRARYYDSDSGQFLNRDPITALGQQPYSYARGDPVNFADPTGLCGESPGFIGPVTPCPGAQFPRSQGPPAPQPPCEEVSSSGDGVADRFANAGAAVSELADTANVGVGLFTMAQPEFFETTVPVMGFLNGIGTLGSGTELVGGLFAGDDAHIRKGVIGVALGVTGIGLYASAPRVLKAGIGAFRSGFQEFANGLIDLG